MIPYVSSTVLRQSMRSLRHRCRTVDDDQPRGLVKIGSPLPSIPQTLPDTRISTNPTITVPMVMTLHTLFCCLSPQSISLSINHLRLAILSCSTLLSLSAGENQASLPLRSPARYVNHHGSLSSVLDAYGSPSLHGLFSFLFWPCTPP